MENSEKGYYGLVVREGLSQEVRGWGQKSKWYLKGDQGFLEGLVRNWGPEEWEGFWLGGRVWQRVVNGLMRVVGGCWLHPPLPGLSIADPKELGLRSGQRMAGPA